MDKHSKASAMSTPAGYPFRRAPSDVISEQIASLFVELDDQTHVYDDSDVSTAEVEEARRLTRAAIAAKDAHESLWITREALDILSRIDP